MLSLFDSIHKEKRAHVQDRRSSETHAYADHAGSAEEDVYGIQLACHCADQAVRRLDKHIHDSGHQVGQRRQHVYDRSKHM